MIYFVWKKSYIKKQKNNSGKPLENPWKTQQATILIKFIVLR